MKKSLHSLPVLHPSTLGFPSCRAHSNLQHQNWPLPLIAHGQNPMFSSPNHPCPHPGVMPWALCQAAEMLTHFSLALPKGICARLQLQGWEQLAWPNSSPKGFVHPQVLEWCRGTLGGMSFLERDGSQARGQPGMLSSRNWSTPVPSTHVRTCHLLLEKQYQMSPTPSCIANFRKE